MCLFGAPVRSDKLGFSAGFDADWGMVARLNRCSDFSSLNFVAFYHICTAVAAAATQSFPPGLTPAYLLLHICLHSCCMLNFWLFFPTGLSVIHQRSMNISHCVMALEPRMTISPTFPTEKTHAGLFQTPPLIPACLIFEHMKDLLFDHPI